MKKTSFASDNNASVHPKIMEAMLEVNKGHCIAYGDDRHTAAAEAVFKDIFGGDTEVFFVYNGTGANVLGMSQVMRPYHAILSSDIAHVNVDECAAPERFTGGKLVPFASEHGKISLEELKGAVHALGFEHAAQPKVLSITQATELGTVYRPHEVLALAEFAHQNGMILHMDGARIANAAVFLGMGLREISRDLGVDILSFGGTKNGMMFGEAVLFFRPELAEGFRYVRKQGMQLASKMRYISAQFKALLTDDLWKENARRANELASELEKRIVAMKGIELSEAVETNGLFPKLPRKIINPLKDEYFFYTWDEEENIVRWMTSFDTEMQDVEYFCSILSKFLS